MKPTPTSSQQRQTSHVGILKPSTATGSIGTGHKPSPKSEDIKNSHSKSSLKVVGKAVALGIARELEHKKSPKPAVQIGVEVTSDEALNENEAKKSYEIDPAVQEKFHNQLFNFFEIKFQVDWEFDDNDAALYFSCKALLLLSLQLSLLAGIIIAQIHQVLPHNELSAYIQLGLYFLMYIFVRAFECGKKYPDNILMFTFLTYFMIISIGNLIQGQFAYVAIIYLLALVCTLFIIVIFVYTTKMEMQGFCIYIVTAFHFTIFSIGFTISTVLFLEKPGTPFSNYMGLNQVLTYFPAFLLFSLAMIFELQRILLGRRLSLLRNEFAVVTMVLPLSIIYPAHLIRKCSTYCRTSKVSISTKTSIIDTVTVAEVAQAAVAVAHEKSQMNPV